MHIYMHKTLFFRFFLLFFMKMHEQCIKLYFLYYISFKMYFHNSSYVIECSMDAFEDVWCMCKCTMYVKLCDVC